MKQDQARRQKKSVTTGSAFLFSLRALIAGASLVGGWNDSIAFAQEADKQPLADLKSVSKCGYFVGGEFPVRAEGSQPPLANLASSDHGKDNNQQVTPGNGTDPGVQTLKAGTSVAHVELENVRDILLDVRRAETAAKHLNDEVSRHPITSYTYADSMGPVMIEIPMPQFDMSEVLPARQKWVELYMQVIAPIIAYIKNDFDGIKGSEPDLNLKDKDKEKFESLLQECATTIGQASDCGAQLQKSTAAPPYDNLAIAKETSVLHKNLREVEKSTKRLIDEVKKSHS